MGAVANALYYTTIGDLIRQYRGRANLTITQLGHLTGIHKGVISKIENGDTKRPELKTIKAISRVLGIPYQEIIEHYVEVEQRTDVLRELLLEAEKFSDLSIISKIALKFLQSPHHDSDTAVERLYHLTDAVSNPDVKRVLYDLIVTYARQHGIQRFLAKGLLQKYLMERTDLKRLKESFRVGEELLHYADFLSREERITFYFRMALHAHNIKEYKNCISLCKAGLEWKTTDTELTARAYLAMINSYCFLEEYDEVEKHLDAFERFEYDFVREAAMLTRSIVKARKKEFDLAIPMLQDCLEKISEHSRIHVVNELLEIYLHTGDLDSFAQLLHRENDWLPLDPGTPYKHLSLGKYYQLKGTFQMITGNRDEGMKSYVNSLQAYGEINAYREIADCMNQIFSQFSISSHDIEIRYVHELKMVYNRIIDKKFRYRR